MIPRHLALGATLFIASIATAGCRADTAASGDEVTPTAGEVVTTTITDVEPATSELGSGGDDEPGPPPDDEPAEPTPNDAPEAGTEPETGSDSGPEATGTPDGAAMTDDEIAELEADLDEIDRLLRDMENALADD